jgi:ATP-binding cassette subfamily F protein 3
MLLKKNHVLLLDEPTNHLDFETVEALALALREANSTVIFVSHNRAFVETLANGIVEVKNGQASRYHHDYENYVYHMQRAIEQDLGESDSGKKPQSSTGGQDEPSKESQEDVRAKLKKAKNRINKIESAIRQLEAEKKLLIAWFEAHPREYSEEKSLRLGDLNKTLEVAESDWLEVQLEIENLK